MTPTEFIDQIHILTSDLHWTKKEVLDELLIKVFTVPAKDIEAKTQ